MGSRRQFKANLKSTNYEWLVTESLERGISMNALMNEIISDLRNKHGAEMVPKACAQTAG